MSSGASSECGSDGSDGSGGGATAPRLGRRRARCHKRAAVALAAGDGALSADLLLSGSDGDTDAARASSPLSGSKRKLALSDEQRRERRRRANRESGGLLG
jgi:hypothetical protein